VKRWAIMTGGLLIWAGQFLGVYLISSAADVVATAADPAWSLAGLAFSLVCLAGIVALGGYAALALRSRRSDENARFQSSLALGGSLIGGVGVLFQTLPLVLSLVAGQA